MAIFISNDSYPDKELAKNSIEDVWWLSWLRQLDEPDRNTAVPGSIPAASTGAQEL
jgi:hypothetical protein